MTFLKRIIALILSLSFVQLPVNAEKTNMVYKEDFEGYSLGSVPPGFSGCSVQNYKNGNALEIPLSSSSAQVKFNKLVSGEYCISFDIAANEVFNGSLKVACGGENQMHLLNFSNGNIYTYNNCFVAKCTDSFKTVTVTVNSIAQTMSVYLNKKATISDFYIAASKKANKCVNSIFSFNSSIDSKIYLDNIVIHSTSEKTEDCFVYNPQNASTHIKNVIPDSGEAFGKPENLWRQLLDGKTAFHVRSGVVYQNGKKSLLENMPFYADNEIMIPLDLAEAILNKKILIDNNKIRIGDDIVMETGNCDYTHGSVHKTAGAAPRMIDGCVYIPLYTIARDCYKLNVYHDDTCLSYGMVIVDDMPFYPPTDTNSLQELNDFLFYERPTPDVILNDYKSSPLCGTHPRLMSDKQDFERIRNEIQTNDIKKNWYNNLLTYCETIMKQPVLKYELRDDVRLMYVSDDFEGYMLCLGMAYQLTGDKKYADAAWKHIESICNFPDWNPPHHIDYGIMAVGLAVAYDWMYDCWTKEQRDIMKKGAYNNCFYIVVEGYKNSENGDRSLTMENNHNVICNGGASMLAIAMMDDYPEIGSYIVSNSLKALEYMIFHFAPFGAWYEGPSYAGMTLDYVTRMFSSIDKVFSKLYSMDKVEGIDLAADYLTYIQSDVSSYNFADADMGIATTAGMFWLLEYFDVTGVKDAYTQNYKTTLSDALVHCLQWYNVNEESQDTAYSLDKYYKNEEIITMRNSFSDGQIFVGIKAGETVYDHSHLDSGSFVFDALGTRWAYDLGKDNYNLPNYFSGNGRWNIFRMRSESHNTIVLNPSEKPGYVLGASAPVTHFESKERGALAKIDMSALLADNANKAERAYLFTEDRRSLIVKDELILPKETDIYWLMYTKAKAEINGDSVILTDRENPDKKLRVEFLASKKGDVYLEDATPFETSPIVQGQHKNEGYYRLVYKTKASGNFSLTAKLTPYNLPASDISEYNKPISEFSVPDGKLKEIPKLDSLIIGGEKYDTANNYITISVPDEESAVPKLEALSEKYNISIKEALTIEDTTTIVISDKESPELTTTYTIKYVPQKRKRTFEDYEAREVINVTASAEPQPANPATNVLDGNAETRWSAENKQWLILELAEECEVDTLLMSMYNGDTRITSFDISVSLDGSNYKGVYSGATSGMTNEYESYAIDRQKVKYIKINFYGTNTGTWNSVTEIAPALKIK